jgi:hypothetical protein
MRHLFPASISTLLACALLGAPIVRGDELSDALAAIKAVNTNGQGHKAAQQAWQTAAKADPARLPELLAAIDDAGPLAANWVRAAVEAVGDRALQSGDKSLAPALEKFTLDTSHAPRGRRLAYDLLVRFDATAPDRLMPGFLNDPSVELRREAIDRVVKAAEKAPDDAAKKPLYQTAFVASRDVDQIKSLAETLKKLGDNVDLPSHFGFIMKWQLIGPFDNVGGKGFNTAYPPETEIKLDAKYPGKEAEVAWKEHTTADPYGMVNLNEALGKNKGAAAYAYAEFKCDAARPVEIRLGCINAVKLWVNGKLLDSREVYHSGTQIDQYIARTTLQPGANQILVKICENEQTESWAQDWQFQLRVCDAVGTAVLSQDRIASK